MARHPLSVFALPIDTNVFEVVREVEERARAVVRKLWRQQVVKRAIEILDTESVGYETGRYDLSALETAADEVQGDLEHVYFNTINNRSAGLSLRVGFLLDSATHEVTAYAEAFDAEMRGAIEQVAGARYLGFSDEADLGDHGTTELVWTFRASEATKGELERLRFGSEALESLVAHYGSRDYQYSEYVQMHDIAAKIFAAIDLDFDQDERKRKFEDFRSLEVSDLLRTFEAAS
jgi:hypothetical protein